MEKRSAQIFRAGLLFAVTALPLCIALEWVPGFQGRAARSLVALTERGLALVCLAGAALLWLQTRFRGEHQGHTADGSFPDPARGITRSEPLWLCLLPLVPVCVYAFVLTERAFVGLFLVDADYAGISAAINNTRLVGSLLPTPYFHTGRTASYLGHHFAPGLLLFTPFYSLVAKLESLTDWHLGHRVYGWLLASFFVAGLAVWAGNLRRALPGRFAALAVALMAIAFPLLRLLQSFHYEVPVLLFSGIAVAGVLSRRNALVWIGCAGWLLWKEDLAVYVGLFAAVLAWRSETRRLGVALGLVALAYFLAVRFALQPHFAGSDGPRWDYLSGLATRRPQFWPLVEMLLAFGLSALAAPRLLIAIVPIALLHAFSGQAWHAKYYGHYSYSILPFLLWGLAEGSSRLEWQWSPRHRATILLLALAIALYVAGGEKEAPIVPPKRDPRTGSVQALLSRLPAQSCLQTEARFSAQAPLRVLTLPYFPPPHNPLAARFPNLRSPDTLRLPSLPEVCARYFVLVDTSRTPLYGRPGETEALLAVLRETSTAPTLVRPISVSQPGQLQLWELRASGTSKGTSAPKPH